MLKIEVAEPVEEVKDDEGGREETAAYDVDVADAVAALGVR